MSCTLSLMPSLERAPLIKYTYVYLKLIPSTTSTAMPVRPNSKYALPGGGPVRPSLPKGLKRAVSVVRFMYDQLVPHPYESLLLVRRVFRAHQLRDPRVLLASWYMALSGVRILAARNALQETVEG